MPLNYLGVLHLNTSLDGCRNPCYNQASNEGGANHDKCTDDPQTAGKRWPDT